MTEGAIGGIVITAAIRIHRELGPGLLESVYEAALAHEIAEAGLAVRRQVRIAIQYRGMSFDEGFRADLIVGEKVIVELKCVEKLKDVHKKQLLTYLRLAGLKLGYLLNFNESLLKKGIVRIANGLEE